jgi:hypothetical protein
MKEKVKTTTDRYGNEISSIEESLFYISCRLDEMTGNAMGSSPLKIDLDPTDLSGVEDKLDNIDKSLEIICGRLSELSESLESISQINSTLENLTQWYIEFNTNNKNK